MVRECCLGKGVDAPDIPTVKDFIRLSAATSRGKMVELPALVEWFFAGFTRAQGPRQSRKTERDRPASCICDAHNPLSAAQMPQRNVFRLSTEHGDLELGTICIGHDCSTLQRLAQIWEISSIQLWLSKYQLHHPALSKTTVVVESQYQLHELALASRRSATAKEQDNSQQ